MTNKRNYYKKDYDELNDIPIDHCGSKLKWARMAPVKTRVG